MDGVAAQQQLPVGAKLQVQKIIDEDTFWREGEVLASRIGVNNILEYYIHYVNFNKRLDEWVPVDRMNLSSAIMPKELKKDGKRKFGKGKAPNTGSSTTSTSLNATLLASAASGDRLPIATDFGDTKSELSESMEDGDEGPPTQQQQQQQQKKKSVRSKAEEIESLRTGGSMTNRPEEVHRVKNIHSIVLGQHTIETWYFSPYPPEFELDETVYICEFCLSYFNSRMRMDRHRAKCQLFHPPGNEIYRKKNISFFEIDGHKQRTYCRNLSLLSKLFLDHKTLYYDVNPFLFYVMTQNDELGCHIVGYFSKEKESADNYNLACILTLPSHQRKGYGRLLIQFSYELSKLENKTGSPEKPLSDLGLLSYRSYWSEVILTYLFNTSDSEVSIEGLSALTSLTNDDILHTMQTLDMLRYYNGQYIIVLNDHHRQMYDKIAKKKAASIDPTCLDWKPPVFSATQLRYI